MNIVNKEKTVRQDGATIQRGKYHTNTNITDKRGNKVPLSVAMVSNCVAHYRRLGRPLKTIWLCPAYFVNFTDWVRRRCTEEQAEATIKQYTFDGVCIDMMPENQLTKAIGNTDASIMTWCFYPTLEEMKLRQKDKHQLTIVE